VAWRHVALTCLASLVVAKGQLASRGHYEISADDMQNFLWEIFGFWNCF